VQPLTSHACYANGQPNAKNTKGRPYLETSAFLRLYMHLCTPGRGAAATFMGMADALGPQHATQSLRIGVFLRFYKQFYIP